MLNSYQTQLENAFRAQQMRQQANQQSSSFIGDMLNNSRTADARQAALDQDQAQYDKTYEFQASNEETRKKESLRALMADPEARKLLDIMGVEKFAQLLQTGGIDASLDDLRAEKDITVAARDLSKTNIGNRQTAGTSLASLLETPVEKLTPSQYGNISAMSNLSNKGDVAAAEAANAGRENQLTRPIKELLSDPSGSAFDITADIGARETDAQKKSREQQAWLFTEKEKRDIKLMEGKETGAIQAALNGAAGKYQKGVSEFMGYASRLTSDVSNILTDAMTQKNYNFSKAQVDLLQREGVNAYAVQQQLQLLEDISENSAMLAGELVRRGMSFDQAKTYVVGGVSDDVLMKFSGLATPAATIPTPNPAPSGGAIAEERAKQIAELEALAAKKKKPGMLDGILGSASGIFGGATPPNAEEAGRKVFGN